MSGTYGGKVILVVDDDANVRAMIVRQLTDAGYDVREASDGQESLKAIARGGIDLVIADLYMPNIDGLEMITRLSQDSTAPRVIAMTGGGHLDRHSLLEMASRMGAARTLEKPFSQDQLVEAVRATLAV